jgi:hypothetical protein
MALFPFLKALSGAAGMAGEFPLVGVGSWRCFICGDTSGSRLLVKLQSCGGCYFLFADLPNASSFVGLRVLGGGGVGWRRLWCVV